MANERLNIPETLKVGFNERKDTYTGRLAYVTYVNNKGQIAKETSWGNWRNKNIDVETYDNVPTEGFVLNKRVGGTKSGWNHRETKCRVYDPRGFEFEITIENLLFILQECTSTKGKGIEGKFVYAWSGPDIVLLPVDSEDYKASTELMEKKEKITVKSLKIGAAYKGKEDDYLIYIGKMEWYIWDYDYSGNNSLSNKIFSKNILPTFVSTSKKKFMAYKNMAYLDYLIEENVIGPNEVEMYIDNFKTTPAYKTKDIKDVVLSNSLEEWELYKKNGKCNRTYWDPHLFLKRPKDTYITELSVTTDKIYQGLRKSDWININYPYGKYTYEERCDAGKIFDEKAEKTYTFRKVGTFWYEDGILYSTYISRYEYITLTDDDWKYISDGYDIQFNTIDDENDRVLYWSTYSKSMPEIEFNENYPLP